MRVVVLEEQAAVVITNWHDEVPWVGEDLGRCRNWEGCGGIVGRAGATCSNFWSSRQGLFIDV